MKFSGINKSYTVDLLYHLSKLPKLRVTCPTVIGLYRNDQRFLSLFRSSVLIFDVQSYPTYQ